MTVMQVVVAEPHDAQSSDLMVDSALYHLY
jgi:hypothetical protein